MNLTNVRLADPWVTTLDEAENARTGAVKVSALVGYGLTRVLTCPGAQAGVSADRGDGSVDQVADEGVALVVGGSEGTG